MTYQGIPWLRVLNFDLHRSAQSGNLEDRVAGSLDSVVDGGNDIVPRSEGEGLELSDVE